ncbi:glycosyltransferase family 4 protein [Streptococcus infantarius]|uniref:glycosyltransferase family 4 protein n=1 Tax=Streptococcus TaxID=1301 RepID=UPI0022E4B0B6|nr:glycosyltransferase family 4 protein [Streptococcus infantarius]
MKILFISHENSLSGANKSMFSIINELHKTNDIDVLVNKKDGTLSKKLQEFQNVGIIYAKYAWCVAHNRSKFIKRSYRYVVDGLDYYSKQRLNSNLINEIKDSNYDLIYTNTSTVDIGFKLSKVLKVPHIWHIREFGDLDFGFKKLHPQNYYSRMYRESSGVIFISEALKKHYEKLTPLINSKVIYNGFDIASLKGMVNDQPNHQNKSINISIVGQVSQGKGQDQAIKACKILKDKGYNIFLNIIGEVDYDYLETSTPGYKEFEWLILHGQVDNVKELRRSMDIELVCSKSEAFGRVTIEAMLAGIPVIASNTGGTIELIEHKQNGLLYNYGDVQQLSEMILTLVNDEQLKVKLVENASRFAEKFTIERTAREVYNFFEEVVYGKDKERI